MRRVQRERMIAIGIMCFAIVLMTIGFASLSSNLNINGTAKVKTSSWDVHFENVANKNSVGSPTITTEPNVDGVSTTVSYEIELNEPGDKYSFTVDVVNDGSLDAKLSSFSTGGVSTAQDVYVNYTVTGMAVNDVLAAGESKTVTISVEYDANVTAADLPTTNQTLDLTATLNFVQNS